MILEFPASYCHLARGVAQVYLLYFSTLTTKSYLWKVDVSHHQPVNKRPRAVFGRQQYLIQMKLTTVLSVKIAAH